MTLNKITYTVAVIPGDGIGPEIIKAAGLVLNRVAKQDCLSLLNRAGS